MNWILHIIMFISACGLLYLSGEWIVNSLMRMAKFLGWREFIIAFLIMAVGTSLPNIFVGISAAVQGISHLSLGDVLGNNLAVLTIATALGVIFSTKKEIPTSSRTVQATTFYVVLAAILPFLLIIDGIITRGDGLILIGIFIIYLSWLFSKKDRFTNQSFDNQNPISILNNFGNFIKDLFKIIIGVILLLLASQGIVQSAIFFADQFNMPIILVGFLIVGLGNALPEIYLTIAAAKRNDTWLILGNLMGAVVILSTLVLGVVSIISPIYLINDVMSQQILVLSRLFIIISAVLFFMFSRLDRKITAKEAYVLIIIYIIFVASAIFLIN